MSKIISKLKVSFSYEELKKRDDKVFYIRGLIRDALRYKRREHNDSRAHMGFYIIDVDIREETLVLEIQLSRIWGNKPNCKTYKAEEIIKIIEGERCSMMF